MQCLKCGREISNKQVFCDSCLEDMEKYPVKPGTPIFLPPRDPDPLARKPVMYRHAAISDQEKIRKLKRRASGLTAALVLTLCALVGAAVLLFTDFSDTVEKLRPGQNYSSVDSGAGEQD